MTKEELLGAIARAWCTEENKNKYIDARLMMAIAEEVMKLTENEDDN